MSNKDVIENLEFCLYKGRCTECSLGEEKSMLSCRTLLEDCRTALKNSVEVVRCKDCKFWTPMDNGISWNNKGRTDGECEMLCKQHYAERHLTQQDHFCGYGKTKE